MSKAGTFLAISVIAQYVRPLPEPDRTEAITAVVDLIRGDAEKLNDAFATVMRIHERKTKLESEASE